MKGKIIRAWGAPHQMLSRLPIPSDIKPKYNVGDILVDVDWDDELSVITDVYAVKSANKEIIVYVHRDLSDMTRTMCNSEDHVSSFYRVV